MGWGLFDVGAETFGGGGCECEMVVPQRGGDGRRKRAFER